jgi:hypothetical protein
LFFITLRHLLAAEEFFFLFLFLELVLDDELAAFDSDDVM